MIRQRTCKIKAEGCEGKYTPFNSLQKCCKNIPCAAEAGRIAVEKKERKRQAQARESIKPRKDWMKEAQAAFNKWVRLRDTGKPCISCGITNPPMTSGGQWDCGHFLSVGSHPELRFEPRNAYRQCKKCNGGSGRFAAKARTVGEKYRENLIARKGLALVEWLEGPHQPQKYTIEQLKEIKSMYTGLAREIESQAA